MSLSLDLAPLVAARFEAMDRADPLRRFHFQSDGQRKLAEYLARGLEVHAHTGNQGGKTTVAAAVFIAMLRGLPELDGVRLPRMKLPATHWVIVKTRKGQVESSQKAYLAMLGEWPHDIGYSSKQLDYIEVIRVKPDRAHSDDPKAWSKIVFHCEEGQGSLPGGRIASAHGDEPPKQKNWEEVRFRGISNQPLYLAITETPIFKSEWWWLFNDPAGFMNCLDHPKQGRVSVNWDVRDVRCHSRAHKRALEEYAEGMAEGPAGKARLSGWPVDDEGSSPFNGKALAMIRAECCDPWQTVTVPLFATSEDESDRATLAETASYDVWVPPKEWGTYSQWGDPSMGYAAGDPSGFLLGEEVDPAIVLEHNGRLDPYSFGWLMNHVGRKYNDAEANVERQGGYGSEAIRALRRAGYPRIGHDRQINNPSGKSETKWGFETTESTRRTGMAAIQAMLVAKLRGETVCKIWSRAIVDEVADTLLDEDGKVVKAPGRHIERVICLGKFLHRLGLPREVTRTMRRQADPMAQALRADFGRDIRKPKSSPRYPEAFRR